MSNSTPTLQTSQHSLPPSPPSSPRSGSAVPKELTTASTILPPVPSAEGVSPIVLEKERALESSQSLKRGHETTLELPQPLIDFLLLIKQSTDDTETIVQQVFNEPAASSAAAEQASVTEHPIISELGKLITQDAELKGAHDTVNKRVLLTQIINKVKADNPELVSGDDVNETTNRIASNAAG